MELYSLTPGRHNSDNDPPVPECQAAVCNASRNCATTNVGGICTVDSYGCTFDVCAGGTCTHPVRSGTCQIGTSCYDVGDTRSSNASLSISVSSVSAPPDNSSSAWAIFSLIRASIFSSTVPWHTNLCTSTFFF